MKKKILLFLVCVNCISFVSMAQLTTGNTTSSTVRSGNRAQAGNFGLYLGITSDIFGKVIDSGYDVRFMPIGNLKYMITDAFELRLGVELNKYSTKESNLELNTSKDIKKITSDNSFSPGFAYHFSKLNILDVYVGAELPIGYARYVDSKETIFNGITSYDKITQTTFNIGLGAFVGVQAYVANLPFAIGFEYGISGKNESGLQYKEESKEGSNLAVIKYSDRKSGGFKYDDLSLKKGAVGNQLRFTLTYFFK